MRNLKIAVRLLVLLCFAAALLCTAAAADRTVYVSATGKGDGTSAAAPFGSLGTAIGALDGKGGTVVFVSPITLSSA